MTKFHAFFKKFKPLNYKIHNFTQNYGENSDDSLNFSGLPRNFLQKIARNDGTA
ncbi:hypothetical protein [Campylobacter troglodytis]|uniref:hypothetical protein n=1 Tax=Campylobacter troglodytis TaxID=654363 RepID=UPI00163CF9F9|nr:hypothetical protein [Campylobacter troglodytis]